jgi:hypothetical protein
VRLLRVEIKPGAAEQGGSCQLPFDLEKTIRSRRQSEPAWICSPALATTKSAMNLSWVDEIAPPQLSAQLDTDGGHVSLGLEQPA